MEADGEDAGPGSRKDVTFLSSSPPLSRVLSFTFYSSWRMGGIA